MHFLNVLLIFCATIILIIFDWVKRLSYDIFKLREIVALLYTSCVLLFLQEILRFKKSTSNHVMFTSAHVLSCYYHYLLCTIKETQLNKPSDLKILCGCFYFHCFKVLWRHWIVEAEGASLNLLISPSL